MTLMNTKNAYRQIRRKCQKTPKIDLGKIFTVNLGGIGEIIINEIIFTKDVLLFCIFEVLI